MSSEYEVASIEDIIEDARNGKPYILVDAPDRENEGDVIIPAQFATPAQINFMATHARGLICLALTRQRADELDLSPMSAQNRSGHGTAFTVSIEAREGVTTGISAHDRAHSIAVAVDPTKGSSDIVSPGHVFPLVARQGGVLVRAGHTEAAVDISRLAGLTPAGVICEIMNDDGTMARMPQLIEFAKKHDLKIATISDLIAYRRDSEKLVERVIEEPFESKFGGKFTLVVYRNVLDNAQHVALVKGPVKPDIPTLVRVHQTDFVVDMLGFKSDRGSYVADAIRTLANYDGPAVGVFLRDPDPATISRRIKDADNEHARKLVQRNFGIGAQILRDIGVKDMILLRHSTKKLNAIDGFGLRVVGEHSIDKEEGIRLVK